MRKLNLRTKPIEKKELIMNPSIRIGIPCPKCQSQERIYATSVAMTLIGFTEYFYLHSYEKCAECGETMSYMAENNMNSTHTARGRRLKELYNQGR